MNGNMMLKAGGILAAAMLGTASVPAQATIIDLVGLTGSGSGFGNSWSGSGVTVTGFSTTGTGGAFQTGYVGNYGNSYGLGMTNRVESTGSPNHSMDNSSGYVDMLLLSFSSAVQLDRLMFGWTTNDSDVSLLRFTGATYTAPTNVPEGNSIATLLSNGWSLVNNYANVPQDNYVNTGASGSSQYWIVSAYSSLWGTGSNTSGLSNAGSQNYGADYLKLWKIDYSTPRPPDQIPEPGSMALLALGLAGLAIMRRRTTS